MDPQETGPPGQEWALLTNWSAKALGTGSVWTVAQESRHDAPHSQPADVEGAKCPVVSSLTYLLHLPASCAKREILCSSPLLCSSVCLVLQDKDGMQS